MSADRRPTPRPGGGPRPAAPSPAPASVPADADERQPLPSGSPPPEPDADDEEDWARRVADWQAGRRNGTAPAVSESAAPPASYEPDPAVYEPPSGVDDPPKRRRFALRRSSTPGSDRRAPEVVAPRHAAVVARPSRATPPASPRGAPAGADAAGDSDRADVPVRKQSAVPPPAPDGAATNDAATNDAATNGAATNGAAAGSAPPSAAASTASFARLGSKLKDRISRRGDEDDDSGPFFPPEAAAPTNPEPAAPAPAAPAPVPPAASTPQAPARPRPRPRSGPPERAASAQPVAAVAPVAEAAQAASAAPARPRPTVGGTAALTAAAPEPEPREPESRDSEQHEADSSGSASESLKAPDISHYVEQTAPAADGDDEKAESKRPRKKKQKNKAAADDETGNEKATKRTGFRELLRRTRLSRRLTKYVILIGVVVAAVLLLRAFVVQPYFIPSGSMEPTLHGCPNCDDDHVLVDKISYHFHHPHVGDIVVFDRPPGLVEPDPVLIKRVVAIGGDIVTLRRGLVYVNGKRLAEPYLNQACGPRASKPLTGKVRWQVPDDDVFVMGDNRCNSTDSRAFGPIQTSTIVGRAFVIVYPFKRFDFL